ncbi:MAG: serine/threonine-protein kinase [Anaerolineae bacterium]|nr:serine/threonine-protein kinase [Anaerolineae bacterium]
MGKSSLLKRLGEPDDAQPGQDGPQEQERDLSTQQIGKPAAPPQPALETRRVNVAQPPLRVEGRLAEGATLQGRYRVLGVIGAGGMSTVYKAQDLHFPRVQRICAIKDMINTATDPAIREMVVQNFEREASLLATLSHPAIPQVYDYFTDGDRSYLVMEFVHGQDLETVLEETDGFLPEPRVVDWAIQICEVLIHLHNHKPNPIIFRDMKPSNVMLDAQNRLRLVDFGIAKVFQSGQKGTMIGTEGYSPPEQYRGIAEPRGDIYALGASLHHLLSKQDPRLEPPFSFHERPIYKSNPLVSAELQEIVNRALEYDMNQRFGSAEEMKRALLGLRSARTSGRTIPGTMEDSQIGDQRAIWQFACEDEVRSSPAVHGGVLYVGAYDNNLYALNAEDGKFKWKYPADGGIASSPCVGEGKVFFGSEDQVLYALNADSGRLVWTCPTKGRIYSSPQVEFGHVFIGSDDHHLYAINTASGRVAWKFEAEGAIRSRPAVGSDAIYFGDDSGALSAIGVNGQLLWRFRARRAVISSPLLSNDMLFLGSQDWHVYALDLRSGWAIWRYRTGGPVVSSPAVDGSTLFIGSSDGEVYALDVTNGYLVWRFKTEDQVASSPAVYDGAVYVGSADGFLYSLNAKTGQLRWKFQTNGPIISSPAVADGIVYVGSMDHNVYAFPA